MSRYPSESSGRVTWALVPVRYDAEQRRFHVALVAHPVIDAKSDGAHTSANMVALFEHWPHHLARYLPPAGGHALDSGVDPAAGEPQKFRVDVNDNLKPVDLIIDSSTVDLTLWGVLMGRVEGLVRGATQPLGVIRLPEKIRMESLGEYGMASGWSKADDGTFPVAGTRASFTDRKTRISDDRLGAFRPRSDTVQQSPLTRQQSDQAKADQQAGTLTDFNQVVCGVLRHSPLARKVGLILQAYFTAPVVNGQVLDPLRIMKMRLAPECLSPEFISAGVVHVTPFTLCEAPSWNPVAFAAKRNPQSIAFGSLTPGYRFHLDRLRSLVTEFDPVAAAFNADHAGERHPVEHVTILNPNVAEWAATRREAGRSALARVRDHVISTTLGDASLELYADDLVRGFTIDIQDVTDKRRAWASLCRRVVSYRIGDTTVKSDYADLFFDEGHLEIAAHGGADAKAHLVSDVIARIDGWSLVCPRPFELDDPQEIVRPLEDVITLAVNRPPLWNDKLPDTERRKPRLPRLLWGHRYRVRACAQDIAGFDMAAQFPDDTERGDHVLEFEYRRVNPVALPRVGRPRTTAPVGTMGEAIESTPEPTELVLVPDRVDRKGNNASGTPGKAPVRIGAPRGSFQMAEAAGKLDGMRFSAILELFERKESGGGGVPAIPDYVPDPHVIGIEVQAGPDAPWGGFAFNTGGAWADPRALDAVISLARPAADLEERIEKALLGKSSSTPAEWNRFFGAAEIDRPPMQLPVIRIPIGIPTTIRFRGVMDQTAPGTDWLRPTADGANPPGRAPAIAHAVGLIPTNTPLVRPRIIRALDVTKDAAGRLCALRTLESDWSPVHLVYRVHEPSTGRVEVLAEWTDPRQKPLTTGLSTAYGETVSDVLVGDAIPSPSDDPPVHAPLPPTMPERTFETRHRLPDGRRRTVRYTLRAWTAFIAHFEGGDPGSTAPGPILSNEEPGSEFGSVLIHLPATHPPERPVLTDIVPTFRELPVRPRNHEMVVRHLRGLRIYLGDTWCSSGDDERLAILAAPADGRDPAKGVSAWGNDPLTDTRFAGDRRPLEFEHRAANGEPAPAADTGHEIVQGYVLRDGLDRGRRVDLHHYQVHWDPDVGEWYGDVDLEVPDVYRPHVNLVLARYQRLAAPGAELSQRLAAGFCQLLPSRTVTLWTDSFRSKLRVRVSGPMRPRALQAGAAGSTTDDVDAPAEEPSFYQTSMLCFLLPAQSPADALVQAWNRQGTVGGAKPCRILAVPKSAGDYWEFEADLLGTSDTKVVLWERERWETSGGDAAAVAPDGRVPLNITMIEIPVEV
jgi:hypothetical protein